MMKHLKDIINEAKANRISQQHREFSRRLANKVQDYDLRMDVPYLIAMTKALDKKLDASRSTIRLLINYLWRTKVEVTPKKK